MGSEFILTTASAGSGKTYALSLRFARFLLTDGPPEVPQGLPNILAITFTRNAAREMKERILGWLKEGYRAKGEKAEELRTSLHDDLKKPLYTPDKLAELSKEAIERILDGYSDFRVDTIDSFAAMVFRASAVDLGYGPDFEISLDPRELLDYAFARYLRRVRPETAEGERFRRILDYLLLQEGDKSRFLWDPTPQIGKKLAAFLTKLSGRTGELVLDDCREEKAAVGDKIKKIGGKLRTAVEASGLEVTASGHYAKRILPAIEAGDFAGLGECSFKTFPVKGSGRAKGAAAEAVREIEAAWTEIQRLTGEYAGLHARDFFRPYLEAFRSVRDDEMTPAKRSRGLLFLDDINRKLHGYLAGGLIVPDVYLRLGDRIYHFLIDEFQDTSPVQWEVLKPLIEESLSRGGSLYIVGDRKQAIYGFRDADFRIMSRLIDRKEGFGPAETQFGKLEVNHRSDGVIVDFVKKVFHGLGSAGNDSVARSGNGTEVDYGRLAGLSGLDSFIQEPREERKELGYVRYILLNKAVGAEAKDGDAGADDEEEGDTARDAPEKKVIQDLVKELMGRGFAWSDIAVLAARNAEVAQVASWLNEKDVEIVSFSNLDIRRRKVIAEILSFLRFLDAPPDDLAFAEFLLGELFSKVVGEAFPPAERRGFLRDCRRDGARPLYAAFRVRHPNFWERYVEPFFKSVGYLPLYDLVTRIYRELDVFRLFPGEEAALTKLLEAIKGFEGEGRNDLREFLDFSAVEEDPDDRWTIDVPRETEAVQMMSIHKAKGKTFPVVICLLYGQAFKGGEFYLKDDDDGVHVFKINKNTAQLHADLNQIYGEARDREWVDRLNSLYVSLTRAKHELYLVGVKGKTARYPFDILGRAFDDAGPEAEDAPAARGEFERGHSGSRESYGKPGEGMDGGDAPATGYRQEVEHRAGFAEPPVEIRSSLDDAAVRRGEWAHRILAEIELNRAGWAGEVAEALSKIRPPDARRKEAEEAGASLERAFGKSIEAAWFEARPGRRVFREFDVCDAGGDVHRLDRVIVDSDSVTVVDFKTGRDPRFDGEYREQIRGYLALLKEVFPELPGRGLLAFIDRDRVEEVR